MGGFREMVRISLRRLEIDFVYYQAEGDEMGNVATRWEVGRETVVLEPK